MDVMDRLARLVMWLTVLGYLGALSRHGPGFQLLVDGVLGAAAQLVPAAVCWLALLRARRRRAEVAWLALGVTTFALGNLVLIHAEYRGTTLPVPSFADVGYLSFYPCVVVAITVAVRRGRRQHRKTLWLDGLLGGLAGASVVAAALTPAFEGDASRSTLASAVSLSYPVLDVVLVFAIIAAASLHQFRLQPRWMALLVGCTVFAASDVVYDLQIAKGTYTVGSVLDGGWGLGLAVMTLWTRARAAPPATETPPSLVLAVPAAATVSSLAVLVAGTFTKLAVGATVLAAMTMLGAAARTQRAFRQQQDFAAVQRQAITDDLTGLPNRRAFYSHVQEKISASPGALLLLDLDKFKEVNDSLGHHVGDELLVQVGDRLSEQALAGHLVARLGGDEFAALLVGANRTTAEVVAGEIVRSLQAPFAVGEIMLAASTSIGIALAPEHGDSLSLLLRRADIAMYRAKKDRLGYRVYADADDEDGAARMRALEELRLALSGDQLRLHYQPKLDLRSGLVEGVEALVRWQHPVRGLLQPVSFLSLVEEAGLMPSMTEVVLDMALDQAVLWQRQGRSLTIAVNVSASSLIDDELPEKVAARLAARLLPTTCLRLEITEEVLMSDRERATGILRRLRETGIQISVDDFGTGYSSLAYLRELPIDELKLDRSFVSPMTNDARARALVVSTIALAHSLGMRMVAEGVEDAEALAELTRHGCDAAQGYFLSKPVPAVALELWLEARAADDSR